MQEAGKVIALASGEYRVLTPQEVTELRTNTEGREIPLNSLERSDQDNEIDHFRIDVRVLVISLSALIIVLIWGQITTYWKLVLVIPLLLISIPLLKHPFENTSEKIGCLPSLFLLFPAALTLYWLYSPTLHAQLGGIALCIITFIVFLLIRRVKKPEPKRLKNSHPRAALEAFYTLSQGSISGTWSDKLEDVQYYLTQVRKGEPADKRQGFDVVLRSGGSEVEFEITDWVFLRPAQSQPPYDHIVIYCTLDLRFTRQSYVESQVFEGAGTYETEIEKKRRYDRRFFTRFDDGWYIDSWEYDPPRAEEIDVLRKAGLLS